MKSEILFESRIPAPGTTIVVEIDGAEVAVANVDGTIHAFDDSCTHRECPLSDGAIAEGAVTCPCHKSRFDLATGTPLSGPAILPLRIRRTTVDGDRLLIER